MLKPCALGPIVSLPSGIVPTYLVILRDKLRSISRQLAVGVLPVLLRFDVTAEAVDVTRPTGAFMRAKPLSLKYDVVGPYT